MSARNKVRSYEQETEIVDFWESRGFEAERAYASVGESLTNSKGETLTEDVDNIVYQGLPSRDLLIQAKRRKSLGSYLVPGGMRDGVLLKTNGEKPTLYVFPDHIFAEMLEGNPRIFLHLDVVDRNANVAGYVFPPDGADVTALRREHDTTSYYVVPQNLLHRIKTKCIPEGKPQTPSGSSLGSQDLASHFSKLSDIYDDLASKLKNGS